MNDHDLVESFGSIRGEGPRAEFVARLPVELERSLMSLSPNAERATMVQLDKPRSGDSRRSQRSWLVAGAAAGALVIVFFSVLAALNESERVEADEPGGTPASTITAVGSSTVVPESASQLDVGEAWVEAVVNNQKKAFIELHAPDASVNETLMAWETPGGGGGLNDPEIADRYWIGFDALHISLETDGDYIRSDGCEVIRNGDRVQCDYTYSLLGGVETSTGRAILEVSAGLVVNVHLDGWNDPPGLLTFFGKFMSEAATEQDTECMAIGFASVDCAEHESDMLRRYIDYAAANP